MKVLGVVLIVVGVFIILGVANSALGALQMPNLAQAAGYLTINGVFLLLGICLIFFGMKLTNRPAAK